MKLGEEPPDPATPTPARAFGALLDRLDALVALVRRRRGLALSPSGALAGAEARTVATVAGLPPGAVASGEVALLTAVGVAVGLLRVRGQRLELTSLCGPWSQLDSGLRAGIVYAAWCHRMPWQSVLGTGPEVGRLHERRVPILRVLHGLPAAVAVDVARLTATLAGEARAAGPALFAAAFLSPLAALGVADLEPAPPAVPAVLRLGPGADTVLAAALLAVGEEVPGPPAGTN
jgi:hypothetical protein